MQKTTTRVIVDRSKKSKRQITYTIYPDQATVRDRWHMDGEKYIHDWSCDCGQAGCRHIVLAKAKAFEKTMPAPIEPEEESIMPKRLFRPFLED